MKLQRLRVAKVQRFNKEALRFRKIEEERTKTTNKKSTKLIVLF